jgi:hypothetical protein
MEVIVEIIIWFTILCVCLFIGHTEINTIAPYVHIKYLFRAISLLLYLIFMYVMIVKYDK